MRLSHANLEKLPKSDKLNKAERMAQLLKLTQMNIDADEDASHLLERVQAELNAPSSSGRPGTGQTTASQKIGAANNVYHVGQPPPSTAGSRPPTGVSIAGSLGGRIAESLLSRQSEFRRGRDALKPMPEERPDTSGSRKPPSTAQSQRPPPTGSSQRPPTGRPASPQLMPPVIDFSDILPGHVVQGFREEYRAMKAARDAEAAEAEAQANAPSSLTPFGEVLTLREHNLENHMPQYERGDTPRSYASSRPSLMDHADHAMPNAPKPSVEPRPWSKKGRRPAPQGSRAASSEISDVFSWN